MFVKELEVSSLDVFVHDELGVGQVRQLEGFHPDEFLPPLVDGHLRHLYLLTQLPGPRCLLTVTQHKAVDVGQARTHRLTGIQGIILLKSRD